jgi:hypothetical protein
MQSGFKLISAAPSNANRVDFVCRRIPWSNWAYRHRRLAIYCGNELAQFVDGLIWKRLIGGRAVGAERGAACSAMVCLPRCNMRRKHEAVARRPCSSGTARNRLRRGTVREHAARPSVRLVSRIARQSPCRRTTLAIRHRPVPICAASPTTYETARNRLAACSYVTDTSSARVERKDRPTPLARLSSRAADVPIRRVRLSPATARPFVALRAHGGRNSVALLRKYFDSAATA